MTLYELCEEITIQGNIEIKVFDTAGNEVENHFFREEYDFHIAYTEHAELEDLQVSFMYAQKGIGGIVWFVIEVTQEDEE